MPNLGKDAFRANIRCPFYLDHYGGKDFSGKAEKKKQNGRTEGKKQKQQGQPKKQEQTILYVKCEGFERGSFFRLCYHKREGLRRYMERVCCGAWEECPYARAAWEKYEEGQKPQAKPARRVYKLAGKQESQALGKVADDAIDLDAILASLEE